MTNDFLNLTNASVAQNGQKIAIRRDLVTTVFSAQVIRNEGDEPETVTCLFCPPHGTWEVRETYDQVWKQLRSTENPERLTPMANSKPV